MYLNNEFDLPLEKQKRIERNSYLQASDKYVLPDYPLTEQQRQEILSYRQALRDMTLQSENPEEWTLPPKPTFVDF